ncbi:hypothetical protein FF1_021614 [Malus domestica]
MEALPSAQIQLLMVTENSINNVHCKHSRNVKPTTKVAVTHIANGDFHHALATWHQMLLRGIRPDTHTLPRVLSALRPVSLSASNSMATLISSSAPVTGCTSGKVIKPGKAVHVFERMMESGAQIDSVAVATVAGACGMLRSLIDGTKVHRKLEQFSKDVISWTEMIHANVKRGGFHDGKHGKEIHGFLLRNGIRMNLTVLNALRDIDDIGVQLTLTRKGPSIFVLPHEGLEHTDR